MDVHKRSISTAALEPGSTTILTTDPDDLQALAAHADTVIVETV